MTDAKVVAVAQSTSSYHISKYHVIKCTRGWVPIICSTKAIKMDQCMSVNETKDTLVAARSKHMLTTW